ncbi:hypothetical protein CN381_24235 [Bacillus cereus]|nr:hypothetical protein CN381_24235 [Bacillus cereus]
MSAIKVHNKKYYFTFPTINAILKNVTYFFVCSVIFPFCLIMKKKDKLNKNIFIEKLFKIAYNQYSF